MEFSVDSLSIAGLALHISCAVLIFVAFCIDLAIYTSDGSVAGPANGWYLALCFLSIAPLLYQSLTLRFVRSRRWANAYAFVVLDILLSILWFSAFVAIAVRNTNDQCGDAKGCSFSKALVGLGFVLFFIFAVCSAISVHALMYYRSTGIIPGTSRLPKFGGADMIDPDREAFNTAMGDEYATVGMKEEDQHEHSGDEAQPYHGYGNMDTSYQGGTGMGEMDSASGGLLNGQHGAVGHEATGTFMSPDDVGAIYNQAYVAGEAPFGAEPAHSAAGNLQFPAGNYR